MQARRCDVLCCVKSKAKPEKGILCGACGDGVPQKPVLQQVMRQLGRMLTLPPVRIAVLLVGAGMLGAGIYGTSQMKVDAGALSGCMADTILLCTCFCAQIRQGSGPQWNCSL